MLINKRYEIISKIGQGAIAEVFKATDTLTQEIVALKIAKPDPALEEKIINEFRIAPIFEHPNIISVYDFGVIRDCDASAFLSRKFLVLEYCSIKDIAKYLSNKPLKDKLQAITQISHALYVIHKAGFVHRDLKPENILIDPKTGEPKIADLGLAIGYEKINIDSLPSGTLHYIAPEILKGDEFDHRADIYSLGILILYILTGNLSFCSNKPIEILKWHLSKKHIQIPTLPNEIEKLLNSMLAPDPKYRPNNLFEIIQTIKKLEPDIKEPENFKVRKPFGKGESLEKAIEILNLVINSSGSVTLVVGADGLGKTSLLRYISTEAKILGFETLWITDINFERIINLIFKSPFALNLPPKLKTELEKLKDKKNLNLNTIIELSHFLKTLLVNASSYFPVVVLIDNLSLTETPTKIFLRSLLLFEEIKNRRIAIFYACDETNFIEPISVELKRICPRPYEAEEIKEHLRIHFEIDEKTLEQTAKALLEHTDGIPALVEMFVPHLLKRKEVNEIEQITEIKFDEILSRVQKISPKLKEILNALSLSDEPVEIAILSMVLKFDASPYLSQLENFGIIKVENEKVSIVYKSLKRYIENKLDEETKKLLHLSYASSYISYHEQKNVDKILFHFVKARDEEGVIKFAEKGLKDLISKGEFKKAVELNTEIIEILPDYLKNLFKIKIANLYLQMGKFQTVISILEELKEIRAIELVSDAYFHLGNTDKAIQILTSEFKKQDTIYGKIRLIIKIAQILASIGELDTASLLLKSISSEKVLRLLQKTEIPGDLFAGLGIVSHLKGDEEKAKFYLEMSLKYRIEKKDPFKIIAGYNNIANLYSIYGEYEKAILYWKNALEISSKDFDNVLQTAHIHNNIGIAYFKMGNLNRAIENYQKAFTIYKAINDAPGLANVLGNIGEVMLEEFKLEEALRYANEAKGIYTKINDHEGLCETNLLLLNIYLSVGDVENANQIFNEINQKPCKLSPHLIKYYDALISMKSKNFAKSYSTLIEILNNNEKNDLRLKALISILKLNYICGGINEIHKLLSIAETYTQRSLDRKTRSLLFFLISLAYERDQSSLALKYLERSIENLADQFTEFKWKIYLFLSYFYKKRGLDFKFLQNLEVAFESLQELLDRIKKTEFIKNYLEDVENKSFVTIIENITL